MLSLFLPFVGNEASFRKTQFYCLECLNFFVSKETEQRRSASKFRVTRELAIGSTQFIRKRRSSNEDLYFLLMTPSGKLGRPKVETVFR
jgi:hypothetical protein